jgi:hypothetical protein
MNQDALLLQKSADGTVRAMNDPDAFLVSAELLEGRDPAVLSVDGDVMTAHLADGDRRYRIGEYHIGPNAYTVKKILEGASV